MTRGEVRVLSICTGVSAGLVALVWALPVDVTAWFFSDDAYYYFAVARNLADGLGSTFDGLNPTNGYHPLWMLLLLPVFAIGGEAPMACLKVVLGLQIALAGVSAWLCWRYVSRRYGPEAALIAVVFLFNALYSALLFNGLESGLLICLLFALLEVDANRNLFDVESNPWGGALAGLLLGVVFLVRLDAAFLVLAYGIVVLMVKPPQDGWLAHWARTMARHLPMAGAFVVLAGSFFVANLWQFGHLTPISGAIKSTFPHPGWHVPLRAIPYGGLLALAIWACSGKGARTDGPGGALSQHGKLLCALGLGSLLHLTWTILFMSWGVFQWHFALYLPIEVVGMAGLYNRLQRAIPGDRFARAAMAVVMVFTVASLAVYARAKGDHHAPRIAAARWAKANTPENAVFAMHDAGAFAYFSQRRTINLDGVINSYAYRDRVREGTLAEYFNSVGLEYVAHAFVNPAVRTLNNEIVGGHGESPRAREGYRMLVAPDAEVYASDMNQAGPPPRGFITVIWRYAGIQLQRLPGGGPQHRQGGESPAVGQD